MSSALFEKIIADLAKIQYTGAVQLYSNNEPFLDERIFDFAALTRESLPNANIILSTNGTLLNHDKYMRIIDSLDRLDINDYRDDFKISPHLLELQSRIESRPEYDKKTFIHVRYNNEIMTTRGGLSPNSKNRRKKALNIGCLHPSEQMIVQPDRKLRLCCNDATGTVAIIGDLNDTDILTAWNSPKAKMIRQLVRASRDFFEICKRCDTIV